jgi:hypothetical protein
VLPVLRALQGHPEAGSMGKAHQLLDDLDIVYTTHERSICRGTIDGKVVLPCREVNSIAAACSDPNVAQGLSKFTDTVLAAKILQVLAISSYRAYFPSIRADIAGELSIRAQRPDLLFNFAFSVLSFVGPGDSDSFLERITTTKGCLDSRGKPGV